MSEEVLQFLDRINELENTVTEMYVAWDVFFFCFMMLLMFSVLFMFLCWVSSSTKREELEREVKSLALKVNSLERDASSQQRDIDRLETRFNQKHGF